MSILAGIVFLFAVAFILAQFIKGIIPTIIIIGISAYLFPLWYTFIVAAICIAFSFGKPVTPKEYVDANAVQRKYGMLFDLLSIILFIIGIILLVISYF